MSDFGSNRRAWDAIDAYVRACGGDPRATGIDTVLTRREIEVCVDEHVEQELTHYEEAAANDLCPTCGAARACPSCGKAAAA